MAEEISNKYPKCNITINGNEYYDEKVMDSAGKAVGSVIAAPFILSFICCTCVLSSLFMFIGYNSYEKSHEYSGLIIFVYILAICCFSSMISSIYSLYKVKKNITLIPENQNRRPCISSKDEKIIV